MTLQQSVDLYNDATFRQRVTAAVLANAFTVSGEAPAQRGFTTYWDKRGQLAQRILQTGGAPDAFMWAVAANPSISAAGTATDSDIEFVVATAWDSIAGIDDDEKPTP